MKIYDGRRRGSLTVSHSFQGAQVRAWCHKNLNDIISVCYLHLWSVFLLQVASYFGHSVAVADINSDGWGDTNKFCSRVCLIGAQCFSVSQCFCLFLFGIKVKPLCSLDDVLIGAPLYMDRVKEQLQERGQVWNITLFLPLSFRPNVFLFSFCCLFCADSSMNK